MALTPKQANAAAERLVADAKAESAAERIAKAKSVPFFFRSSASKNLDRWQEWVAYRQAAKQPFHRNPLVVGALLVCVALVLLLFWLVPHPLSLSAYLTGLVLIALPHAARIMLVRNRLEQLARSQGHSGVKSSAT